MKTILVVDDEFDLVNTLRAILEGEGYRVETSPDGQAALDRLRDGLRPDLLLMDVMMPLLGGLDVLESVRRTPGLEDLPVVLMSVVHPSAWRDVGGWQAFLHKPFTLQAVVATVSRLTSDAAAAKPQGAGR